MDWQKIITDLLNTGYTQKELADAVKCSQAYVSDLKRGNRGKKKDVPFEIGHRIYQLWKKRCGDKAA